MGIQITHMGTQEPDLDPMEKAFFEMTALTGWGFGVPPLGRGRCAL